MMKTETNELKLSPGEAAEAGKTFAYFDGMAEGFRLGMEVAKKEFLSRLVKSRPIESKETK